MARINDADLTSISAEDPSARKDSKTTLPIPSDSQGEGPIEVPASKSSISNAKSLMHNLSLSPSMKDRRASRNSFGTSLPIPRSPRASRVPSSTHREASPSTRKDILASQIQDLSKEKVEAAKNMAFVFDVDGVLLHGDHLIPESRRVMELLNGDNELGIKIPYILLTNGGGKTEVDRTDQLSRILGSPISTEQFVQSHTPMQALAEYYETVLVLGGDGYGVRKAAESYGFRNIVIPQDIIAWDPTISPYGRPLTEEDMKKVRIQDFDRVNFDAILQFTDSRDYATEMQLIIDLLLSENGRLRTRAKDPTANQIPIYFSHGDLLFQVAHKLPRLTQGAFRVGIEAMYKSLTGGDLERVVYGKPELATYKYADEVIQSWMKVIHNERSLPENIYMIGDNPQSDIIGGNMYGWNTCLVRTGVFNGGENDENNPANFGVFDTVLDAVQAAVRKELGQDFRLRWKERRINPVHQGEDVSAIE